MRSDVPPSPRAWSGRQLAVLAAVGIPVLRLRRPSTPLSLAAGPLGGWPQTDRDGPLAKALASALGVPVEGLQAFLERAGVMLPPAAELRASADAKRHLWRQLRGLRGRWP
jgi:hypothetical protein